MFLSVVTLVPYLGYDLPAVRRTFSVELGLPLIIDCPHCQAFVEVDEQGNFEFPWTKEHPSGRYVLLKCKGCMNPILVIQDNIGNLVEGDIWDTPRRIYPVPEFRVNPKAPEPIRIALEEALICLRNRAYTATAIMCRKTLEGVCVAHGVKKHNLIEGLRGLRDADLIDERLFEWSDALRHAGNEAAHDVNVTISQDDARDISEFTIAIVDYLFSYRDQFERFKQRRSKIERERKGRQKKPE